MLDIFDMFLVGGVFCGFITSLLLFTQARFLLHANRLLGVVIFAMAWYAFYYLLFKTGWVNYIPNLYCVGSPLYYMVGPCCYLYGRSLVMDESRFRKWDWLHFLPAILHCIEMLPFYFSDTTVKRQAIEALSHKFNDSRIMPAIWHFVLRPLHAMIYVVCLWVFLARSLNRKNSYHIHAQLFRRIRTWLFSFTALMTVAMGSMFVQVFFNIRWVGTPVSIIDASWQAKIPAILSFFVISAYLFFNPDVLYGTLKVLPVLPKTAPDKEAAVLPSAEGEEQSPAGEELVAKRETLLNEEQIKLYSDKIEEHLLQHQSFRTQGLTISQLAKELALPVHHLSYVINHHYRQRFGDFINRYRVDYVKQLFRQESWREKKLETLAAEAGFASRSNFFAVFKKVTGVTPADYIRQMDVLLQESVTLVQEAKK